MIDAAEMEKFKNTNTIVQGLIWQYNIYHIKRTEKEVSDYLKKNDINEMTVQK